MTTALTEDLQVALADQARQEDMTTEDAHHTNVFVCIDYDGSFIRSKSASSVYGPFRSFDAAKDWGLANSVGFSVFEILRPRGVESVGFVLTTPTPPRHDPGQTQIGDYIDPTVVP